MMHALLPGKKSEQFIVPDISVKMEEIYDRWSSVLYGCIIKLAGEKQYAEDILLSTFHEIKVKLEAGCLDTEPGWYIKCAFKKSFEYLKEKGLQQPSPGLYNKLHFIPV